MTSGRQTHIESKPWQMRPGADSGKTRKVGNETSQKMESIHLGPLHLCLGW